MRNKKIAKTREDLKEIIQLEIKVNGNNCDLNHIDVSRISDMNRMFANSKFNGDISKWNVSKVTDMDGVFWNSQFNGDISRWNTSNVTDMKGMLCNSQFNGEISNWNVSNVTDMYGMFYRSKFNGDLTKWLPYSLEFDKDAFKDCTASRPYWANFNNLIDRCKEISKYLLYSELNSNLQIKENFTKKHKI